MFYRSDDVGRQYQRNVNKYKTQKDLVEVIVKLPKEREKSKQKECCTCAVIFINTVFIRL